MELRNLPISKTPQFFSNFSSFTHRISIKTSNKKPLHRLHITPSFPLGSPSRRSNVFHVSAHFGRKTNRRNSLRKKLIADQKVRQNPIPLYPSPDIQNQNEGFEKHEDLNSCSTKQSDVDNVAGELKPKRLGESVLLSKLENWVDQYKKDAEFWGIGSGPIFTVSQDFEGNVKRVTVHEDEILKRLEFEDTEKANSRVLYAKNLAREMESGDNVIPRTSSVAKFVVSGEEIGFVSSIRGVVLRPEFIPKLKGVGILVLGGLIVLSTVKLFVVGKKEVKYTELEKEMMRRKIKSRKGREISVKGDVEVEVEVVQASVEPPSVSFQRPQLDKQELMNNILKAKAPMDNFALLDSSGSQSNTSGDFESEIQEIRLMARKARETESREQSAAVKDENDVQAANKEFSDELQPINEVEQDGMVAKKARETECREQSVVGKDENDVQAAIKELSDELRPINGVEQDGMVAKKARETECREQSVAGKDENDVQAANKEFSDELRPINGVEQDGMMAKKAQETECREQSVVGKDENEVQAAYNDFSNEVQPINGVGQDDMNFLSNLSTEEDSGQGEASNKSVESISSDEPKGGGVKFVNGVASLDRRAKKVSDASSIQLPKDEQSTKEDLKDMENDSLSFKGECNQAPVIPDNESDTAKSSSFGKKPRVILSVKEAREFLSTKSNKEKLNQEPVMESVQESVPDLILPNDKNSGRSRKQIIDTNDKMFPRGISTGDSEYTASENAYQSVIRGDKPTMLNKENDEENSDEEYKEEIHEQPLSYSQESIGTSKERGQSVKMENWIENNFHEVEPVLKKIGDGFRENYMVARERAGEKLNLQTEIEQLGSNEDEIELEWMKDEKLRDIVFQVRENELSGRDPFYLMDAEEKLAFFRGLETKVEKQNENLSYLHEWLHSNIENLDYGADGISLHDPPEKFIPRWKGPPLEKSPEFLSNFEEQRKSVFTGKAGKTYPAKNDGQSSLQKPTESPINEDLAIASSESDLNRKVLDAGKKDPKIVIEASDGSVKPGKKSGKEYWQHTKKWSRGFVESYNAENDPEVKSIMKDMGKDLNRWITEKEIQEAADLKAKLPERNKKFMEKKLNKLKREMELFGPQAVVSKYQEYADEKEEDYLWWLDLPHVLCIELYTSENEEQRVGFYALEMAADLELEPKPNHVIAFEDAGDCKSFCYIMQAHMEMLGNGMAFIVPQPPKDAFREAKANNFGVTVIRKGELRLNVDQTLEEVEEQICEIGSKMYHDMIMRERSVDISTLMKGMLGAGGKPRRRRSKKKLKKPSK